MAELELSVKYETLANRIGFYFMAALFPVWSLLVPFLLGLVIAYLVMHPTSIANPQVTLAILLGLTSVPVLGIMLTAFFEDNRVYISKSGISFPVFMLPLLGFRRNRSWAELRSAGVIGRRLSESKPNETLLLSFNKTLPVKFKTKSLDKVQLEQMLLAIELWSGKSVRTPELVDYQNQLHNENKGLGRLSQVEMWEEELSRRFSATSFVPLEPGRKLFGDSIEIVRQLAFGGLSAIYLAQQNNKNIVVIKEAVVPSNADEETRKKAAEHFFREARFLMTLDNPKIAKVLGHFSDLGRDYLMMQYIPGQDLRQLVKQQGAQPELKVVDWGLEIVEILKYLHGQTPPVIHRDLTPDNLVLNAEGELVLIDFGAANQFVGTATGTLVGKQSYIAPEQLRGKAACSSDIYSLGGTLYWLLTGQDPLPLASSHPMQINSNVGQDLDELVSELTIFDIENRLCDLDQIYVKLSTVQQRILSGKEAGPAAIT
ncbi:MAG: serine/threonine protein kinase, partial [Candidatus Obscuribacterales bacterium]|nr:serine/threonine protein kinase [Candidatus Obscuribacterales bacterium]